MKDEKEDKDKRNKLKSDEEKKNGRGRIKPE
jgi:hypothetical protein